MNLDNPLCELSDEIVVQRTGAIIQTERQITVRLLCHLREIERRMLYAKLGYPSLYELMVRHFNYSSGAAYRRITAMRLLREMPEVEAKIESGAISLTTAAKVQTYFRDARYERQSPLSLQEKKDIVASVENKSARDVEKQLLELSPNAVPRDRTRAITETLTEIKIIADAILKSKLDYLKLLLSNKLPISEYKDVISEASDIAIEKLDSALSKQLRGAVSASRPQGVTNEINRLRSEDILQSDLTEIAKNDSTEIAKNDSTKLCGLREAELNIRAKIPSALKRAVWARDGGRCSYKIVTAADEQQMCMGQLTSGNPVTQAGRCGARYRLQVDHILPVAKGGTATLENLRLLCETHNQYEARRVFGSKHMAQFIKKLE